MTRFINTHSSKLPCPPSFQESEVGETANGSQKNGDEHRVLQQSLTSVVFPLFGACRRCDGCCSIMSRARYRELQHMVVPEMIDCKHLTAAHRRAIVLSGPGWGHPPALLELSSRDTCGGLVFTLRWLERETGPPLVRLPSEPTERDPPHKCRSRSNSTDSKRQPPPVARRGWALPVGNIRQPRRRQRLLTLASVLTVLILSSKLGVTPLPLRWSRQLSKNSSRSLPFLRHQIGFFLVLGGSS